MEEVGGEPNQWQLQVLLHHKVEGESMGWVQVGLVHGEDVQQGLAELHVEGTTDQGMMKIFNSPIFTVFADWGGVWSHSVYPAKGWEELVEKPPEK